MQGGLHLLLPLVGPLLVLLADTAPPTTPPAPLQRPRCRLSCTHPVKTALTANHPASLTAGLTASPSYLERQRQLDHGGENGDDDDSAVTGRAAIG